jgi:hypothetical protein
MSKNGSDCSNLDTSRLMGIFLHWSYQNLKKGHSQCGLNLTRSMSSLLRFFWYLLINTDSLLPWSYGNGVNQFWSVSFSHQTWCVPVCWPIGSTAWTLYTWCDLMRYCATCTTSSSAPWVMAGHDLAAGWGASNVAASKISYQFYW